MNAGTTLVALHVILTNDLVLMTVTKQAWEKENKAIVRTLSPFYAHSKSCKK